MEDAGFIIGSYVLVFGAVALYASHVLRSARRPAPTVKRAPYSAA